MAIGTPTIIGSLGNASTSLSMTITTTGSIATHDVMVLWHYSSGSGSTITGGGGGISDTAGNTYVRVANANSGANPLLEVFVCYNAIAMASGNSIITAGYGNASRQGLYVVSVAGLLQSSGAWDSHTAVSGTEKSTGTSSPATVIPATAAAQMIVLTMTASGNTAGTYTPTASPAYTALTPLTTNAFMYPEYRILSTISSAGSSNPTWVNSIIHATGSIGLVGIPATNTSRQAQGTLLGVGV